MAKSSLFLALEVRLNALASALLPPTSPTGTYSPAQNEQIYAYRLLAHASFESFVEEKLIQHVRKKKSEWDVNKKCGRVIAGLLAYCRIKWPDIVDRAGAPPTVPAGGKQKDEWRLAELEVRLTEVVEHYCAKLEKGNNGIKEKNLVSMLVPIGYSVTTMDQTWLGHVNSFGTVRGFAAHNSNRTATTLPDPVREQAAVGLVLAGFETLDEAIDLHD